MFTVLFWKKAWIWLKHYWYWPVIITLLLFSVVAGTRAKEGLLDLLFKQRESYEKELEIVKNVNNQKDRKKAEAFESHKEELEELEKQNNFELEKLQEEKQEELISTMEEGHNQPERLAKKIAKILSVEYFNKNR
jgi:biopolymer transport protein ExbB/TolQ